MALTVPGVQKIFKVIKSTRSLDQAISREDLYPSVSSDMNVDLDKFLRYLISKQDG